MGQEHGGRQRLAKGAQQTGQQPLDLLAGIDSAGPVEGGEARRQLRPLVARHGVIRQTQTDGVRPVEAGPGEAEPESEPTRHAAQKPAGPYVGIEAYGHLRHGEQALLGHHPKTGPGKEADAAPHADAVRHADEGLAVAMDVVIEPVLLLKEVAGIAEQCRLARLLLAVIEGADVAAGAKRLLAGPLQQHADDGRILLPAGQRPLQQPDHLKAQGIEGGGAVQGQHADVATIRGGVGLDAHRLTHGWPPQTGYQPL